MNNHLSFNIEIIENGVLIDKYYSNSSSVHGHKFEETKHAFPTLSEALDFIKSESERLVGRK